jgi:hypothetical protein
MSADSAAAAGDGGVQAAAVKKVPLSLRERVGERVVGICFAGSV